MMHNNASKLAVAVVAGISPIVEAHHSERRDEHEHRVIYLPERPPQVAAETSPIQNTTAPALYMETFGD